METAANRTRVALVFGGQSSEHGISCLTAASVLEALLQADLDVVAVGIAPSGRWRQVALDEVRDYRIVDGRVPEVPEPEHDAVWMVGSQGCEVATRQGGQLVDVHRVDVAFALLHGPFGEDGTIQGLFEMMGIRYVGSGVAASAIGMDKHFMKVAFAAAGLPVGPYAVVTPERWLRDRQAVLDEAARLEFPVFVKPCRGGSSMGITRVTEPLALPEAIEVARRHDPKVIIEQGFIRARELECAVLADDGSEAGLATSAIGEIRVHADDGFYDFEAKYLATDQAALDVPASVDDDLAARIQDISRRAFHAVGAEGLARVDVFADGDGSVWVNEINTMPGFTEISMYPALWQHSGISYPELVSRLVRLALERPVGLR